MNPVSALKSQAILPDKNTGSTATLESVRSDYTRQRDKLKKATQDFESIFITQMLKQAHKSLQSEGALFGNSSEAKFYAEMRDEMLAQHLSKTGQFGVGNLLYKKLEKTLPLNPDQMLKDALKNFTLTRRVLNEESKAIRVCQPSGINPRSDDAKPAIAG